MNKSAYKDGYESFLAGFLPYHNPYTPSSWNYYEWSDGFYYAYYEWELDQY